MALPRFVHLTSELRTLISAAWRGLRAFTTTLRARPPLEPPVSSAPIQERFGLPDSYGRTRLVVLPVDPYAAYAYWELTPASLAEAYHQFQKDTGQPQPVLRFQEASPDDLSHGHRPVFDIEIQLEAQNWYIPLWSPGHSYDVSLGFKSRSEKFLPLTRSNRLHIPRAWPESRVDEHFVRLSGEERRAETVLPQKHEEPPRPRPIRLGAASFVEQAYSAWQRAMPGQAPQTVEIVRARQAEGAEAATTHSLHNERLSRIARPVSPIPPVSSKQTRVPDLTEAAERRFISGVSSILPQEAEL